MTSDTQTLKSRIDNLAKSFNGELVWGVRFDRDNLPVGHIFGASRVWRNDKPTRKLLPGTSIIRADALYALNSTRYMGTCYIVAGYRANNCSPDDDGEEIVTECEIMEVAE